MIEAELDWVDTAFDPDVLTIGFARRVPSYKRLTLMLRDPERLKSLLLDPDQPVQIVIAGKSHPADDGGKQLIAQMVRFADDPAVRHRIAFLPNYDIAMAKYLYWGVDVWLNNPLRPLEACGTSGMKAALNGALNLSILDGWWDEWFDGENGWAIPSADGVTDPDRRDDLEAHALYELIEKSVASQVLRPQRQGRADALGADGAAHAARPSGRRCSRPGWCATTSARCTRRPPRRRRASPRTGSPPPRSCRPGAARCSRRGRGFGCSTSTRNCRARREVGNALTLRAEVALNGLSPDDVCVEAVYGPVDMDDRLTQPTAVRAHARRERGRDVVVRGRDPARSHRLVRLHGARAAGERSARLARGAGGHRRRLRGCHPLGAFDRICARWFDASSQALSGRVASSCVVSLLSCSLW